MSRHIGYKNHNNHPVSIFRDGSQHEIPAGYPIVRPDGLLVEYDDQLEILASQGIIRRIPENDPDFKNHDKIVKQRKTASIVKPKSRGDAPRRKTDAVLEETIIRSSSGLPENSDLPDGAVWTRSGTGQVIEYDGKKFPNRVSLDAYIAAAAE